MGIKRDVHVIPNATNPERYRFDKEKREQWRDKLGLTRFTFFSAGNLIPRKGVIDFYEIAETLPEYDFVWYGKKWNPLLTLKREFSKRVEEQPGNVHLPGFVTDINGAFSACDSLLFTSYSENQPMAILESAAMGRVIIARDIPEYKNFLIHGENALLATTVEEFVQHVTAVANDESLRKKLMDGALSLAEKHNLQNVGQHILDIYENLLGSMTTNGG
jgi:1,2-diacylglycerol-3-alpha-glucose alpha-1,2-glucosyltransferase